MVKQLQEELDTVRIQSAYTACCSEYKSVSPEIERLHGAIEDLANSVNKQLVDDAKGIEQGLKDKCAEIKALKLRVKKILEPKIMHNQGTEMTLTSKNAQTQATTQPETIIKEVVRIEIVEKIVEKPIEREIIKVVEKIIEKPVIVEKVVIKEVEKIIEKPIIVEKEIIKEVVKVVEKIIEVPIEKVKIVEVEK